MAIKRVQSHFAAQEREIRRTEDALERARQKQDKAESRAHDARLRQAGADRRRQEEIRRKAGLEEIDAQSRRDLIQSLVRGRGVGMFAAKVPRINKFILHAPEMEKDPATGKLIKAGEITGETRIDTDHIEKLRTLSQLTRDREAARALEFHRTGRLPPKAEKAMSDLASDDFPGRSRQEHLRQAMAAPIFEGAPEQEVGPVEMGGLPVPEGGQAEQMFPLAEGDVDLTQLLQRGILGPPPGTTPETFRPGFEQGFQGIDEPAPIANIHEAIQAGALTGRAAPAGPGAKLQEEIAALEAALGRKLTDQELLIKGKAVEKGGNIFEQLGMEQVKKTMQLGTGTATAAPAAPTPKAPAPKAPTAPREATSAELAAARRNFLEDNPGAAIKSITSRGGQIVIVDAQGTPWFSPVEG